MSDTLHLAPESDSDGFDLSQFVSLLGIEPRTSGTFFPASGAPLGSAWEIWQETLFLPVLLPVFLEVHAAISMQQTERAIECDKALDALLPPTMQGRSKEAGIPFLEGKTEMRGNREWTQFSERVLANESPGHLAVLFAAQTALYHLALPAALAAYADFEFRSREEKFPFAELSEEETKIFETVLPRIPLALRSNSRETGEGEGMLRVI